MSNPRGKTPQPKKVVQPKRPVAKPEPLYPLIGINRVNFRKAASALSDYLTTTYGPEVSITKYEKILIEIKDRRDLQGRVHIQDHGLDLLRDYNIHKALMIEEQNAFRRSFALTPVQTITVATSVAELFGGQGGANVNINANLPQNYNNNNLGGVNNNNNANSGNYPLSGPSNLFTRGVDFTTNASHTPNHSQSGGQGVNFCNTPPTSQSTSHSRVASRDPTGVHRSSFTKNT